MLKGYNSSLPWRDPDGKLTDQSWSCTALRIFDVLCNVNLWIKRILILIDCPVVCPVVWGLEFSQRLPLCVGKSRLIKGYELSYATGSLNAGSSCIRWGVWVWTVGHWVVPVQVIYCSIGGWVLLKKKNGFPERSSWVAAIVVSPIFQ